MILWLCQSPATRSCLYLDNYECIIFVFSIPCPCCCIFVKSHNAMLPHVYSAIFVSCAVLKCLSLTWCHYFIVTLLKCVTKNIFFTCIYCFKKYFFSSLLLIVLLCWFTVTFLLWNQTTRVYLIILFNSVFVLYCCDYNVFVCLSQLCRRRADITGHGGRCSGSS